MNRKELFDKAKEWFDARGWKPFPFQTETWTAFLQGKNGLLNAPTGSGKTYALWVPIVLSSLKTQKEFTTQRPEGLQAIWITPLRALSNEIAMAAERFTTGLGLDWTIGIRTGDTPQKERAAQKRRMPNLLVTTPESLQLLIGSKNHEKQFKNIKAIVIDEWHELLGSKRGVQTELGLSRLRAIQPKIRVWGISATIGNLNEAREVLLGPESDAFQNSVLVKANLKKKINVISVIPEEMETFPWRGHLGIRLLDQIIPILKQSKTVLMFFNTRAQCEIWFQQILNRYPEFAGEMAMHHGSIEKETRLWIEQAIRDEKVKVVICTSSLDLGVDFAPVETVIQVGGPKGVARFLQRAGRSGHQPGKDSEIYFLPTHALELIEASALREAVKHTIIEDRDPYLNSFDVLAQYLVTLAVGDGFYPEKVYKEVKQTFCYQSMTPEEWQWILNFIVYGSQSLKAYDDYKKVEVDENGKYIVTNRSIAMRHRLQIGTIVGDSVLSVKFLSGGSLGSIEEYFISKLKPGDVFMFAGRNLELYKVKNMQVLVKKSNQKTKRVATWQGTRMTLSAQMGDLLRKELYKYSEQKIPAKQFSPELKALDHIFVRQQRESIVPKSHEFLVETFKTREGFHTIFYPFEGRRVHEAMGSLLAYRISLLQPITISLAFNDYGFELLSDQQINIQEVIDNDLFSAEYMRDDLQKSLNATEMARRQFRYIAIVSGLVFTGYPNRVIKTKHLQASSQLLFDVFRDYEPDNLLFQQAIRETFEHQLEEGRLLRALEYIHTQDIVWKQCQKPTPFSFPIITDRLREKLSSEKLEDRIRRMTTTLMRA